MSDFIPAQPGWYVVSPDQPPRPVLAWLVANARGPLRALVPPREPDDPAVVEGVYEYHPDWGDVPWSPAADEAYMHLVAAQDSA